MRYEQEVKGTCAEACFRDKRSDRGNFTTKCPRTGLNYPSSPSDVPQLMNLSPRDVKCPH